MGRKGATADDPAEALRYVFVEVARCPQPKCRSARLKTLRTNSKTEDATTRRKQCRDCGHKFYLVIS